MLTQAYKKNNRKELRIENEKRSLKKLSKTESKSKFLKFFKCYADKNITSAQMTRYCSYQKSRALFVGVVIQRSEERQFCWAINCNKSDIENPGKKDKKTSIFNSAGKRNHSENTLASVTKITDYSQKVFSQFLAVTAYKTR